MTVRANDRRGTYLPNDVRRANYDNLATWQAAFNSREKEGAEILALGDSITNGGFSDAYEETYTYILAEEAQTTWRPSSSRWYGIASWLTPWVNGGGLSSAVYPTGDLYEAGGIGVWAYLLSGTKTITLTVPSCDRYWAFFEGGTGSGDAEIRVNGTLVTGTGFATNSGSLALKVFDSGALDNGPKTIEVKAESGATVVFSGLYVWNGDYGKGIHVWDVGHSGYTIGNICDNMLGRAGNSSTSLALSGGYIVPSAVLLEAGLNDLAASTSISTFVTNFEYAIDALRNLTLGPDPSIVLQACWARSDSTYTDAQWQPYREAIRGVAERKDCVFFDMYDLAGWTGVTGTSYHTGGTTSGTSITLPTGFFRGSGGSGFDIGATVTGDGITGSRTISNITSTTVATLSSAVNSNVTGTGKFQISSRKDPNILTTDGVHPSSRGHRLIAAEYAAILGLGRTTTSRIGFPVTRYKSLDQTVSVTGLADDTHLKIPMIAGAEYVWELYAFVLPAAQTTGPAIGFNGPTVTSVQYGLLTPANTFASAATSMAAGGATAWNTTLLAANSGSATVPTVVQAYGHCLPTANGYLVTRIAADAAANITFRRGSWLRLTRVA